MSENALRETFMYSYGRATGPGSHYSVRGLRVDLAKSQEQHKMISAGTIGEGFKKVYGQRAGHFDNGMHSDWAQTEDHAIVWLRGETVTRPYSARISEVYILLHKKGPLFYLDIALPTNMPERQFRVFSGSGFILTMDELDDVGIIPRRSTQVEEQTFWLKGEDEYDEGVFIYAEQQPAVIRRPLIEKTSEQAVIVPDTRVRRRILVPTKAKKR